MNAQQSPPSFQVLVGLDWGDSSHAVSLRTPDGTVERSTLAQDPAALRRWADGLRRRFPGARIALALEASEGPVVNALLDLGLFVLYPVHPATSARLRTAFRPSGAKDDAPDADVLLDLLVSHFPKLRPLHVDDPETRRLAALVELRRKFVDRRTGLVNALEAALKAYFPLALAVGGEHLHAPLMLDLLERWPDLPRLQSASAAALRAFFNAHNLRRPQAIATRVAAIKEAQPLTTDPVVLGVKAAEVLGLVAELRVLGEHIGRFQEAIALAYAAHPNHAVVASFPGAGPTLGPRLAAALGTDPDRYPDASSLQKYSGIAPVREKSGSRCWVHWRWHAPRFLRQSFHEWAGQTVVFCDWAHAYYRQRKDAGTKHHIILRALAYKWQRILWRCWRDNRPYDENTLLESRARNQAHATG